MLFGEDANADKGSLMYCANDLLVHVTLDFQLWQMLLSNDTRGVRLLSRWKLAHRSNMKEHLEIHHGFRNALHVRVELIDCGAVLCVKGRVGGALQRHLRAMGVAGAK